MFGSCESIFDQQPKHASTPDVSATELQMMEMEISTDLAKAEVDLAKVSATTMQLDQVFNMYNHVKRFGIDRTFLSLYNSNSQLDNMIGVRFPSCESVDSEGYPGSNMSKAFIAAMEDNKEGVFAKIIKGIKWVWEKIKNFCSTVWNKVKSWIGLGNRRNKGILAKVANALRGGAKPSAVKRVVTKKRVVATAAVVAATIAAIYAWRKYRGKDGSGIAGAVGYRPDQSKTAGNSSGAESGSSADVSPEVKQAEAKVAEAKEALAKVEQEEKEEVIEAPAPQQVQEIIATTNESITQVDNLSKEVDKATTVLQAEVAEGEKALSSNKPAANNSSEPPASGDDPAKRELRRDLAGMQNKDAHLSAELIHAKEKLGANSANLTRLQKKAKAMLEEAMSTIKGLSKLQHLNDAQTKQLEEAIAVRDQQRKELGRKHTGQKYLDQLDKVSNIENEIATNRQNMRDASKRIGDSGTGN